MNYKSLNRNAPAAVAPQRPLALPRPPQPTARPLAVPQPSASGLVLPPLPVAVPAASNTPSQLIPLSLPPHRDLQNGPAAASTSQAPSPPNAQANNAQVQPGAGQELTLEQQYITAVEGIVPTLQ